MEAQVRALRVRLDVAEGVIDQLKFERDSNPVDAPSMTEIAADSAKIRRAEAAKKGWATRRANAQPERLTRDEYIAKHGSLPEDKSYSITDADGYPITIAALQVAS